MNTRRQINAMVVVLLLSLIAIGAYTIWDPVRSESAEDDQLEKAVERGANTFAQDCRLCHGDRAQGPPASGRLAAALPLDREDLRGIVNGVFDQDLHDQKFKFITDTITCGRPGKAMAPWGQSQGGKFSDEQIRQLAFLITEGRWDLAQEYADEIDATTTNHATVQMPDGLLGASETELVVSNADPFFVDEYIRIEDERLHVTEIASTGQRIVEEIGRTPREFMVSGASGIDIGATLRIDGELMEVTAVRDDGDPGITLDGDISASATRIAVSEPAFFGEGDVFGVGDELIQVEGPVELGQTLAETVGRAESIISVSGIEGLEPDTIIRMDDELLRVVEIVEPAQVQVQRSVNGVRAVSHEPGTGLLAVTEDSEQGATADGSETAPALVEPISPDDTTFAVDGVVGLAVGQTYRLRDEFILVANVEDEAVLVTDIEPARVRVERAVGGTSRAEHARRAEIYRGNMLDVIRGVEGSQASGHGAGDELSLAVVEVRRAVAGSAREIHARNEEIYLGNSLIVERGVLSTEPADHASGVLVRDFPLAPENPALTGDSCGQIPQPTPVPVPTPTPGPSPTPGEGTEVGVSLAEFSIAPDPATIVDGAVNFQVNNDGVILHDFRVIATDLAVDALPMDSSGLQVDESQVDVVGSSQLLEAGTSELVAVQLPPGNYVLICNVATHYQAGMRIGFSVTAP